jgi:DNA-binding NtrC family response regulator
LFSKGSDAIAFYSTSFNEVDVVLLDMIMPEMSGQQVYNILKKYNNDLVVIFMSGYNTNESMQSILSLTKADFLQKPFTFEQLRKSLSNCLAVA